MFHEKCAQMFKHTVPFLNFPIVDIVVISCCLGLCLVALLLYRRQMKGIGSKSELRARKSMAFDVMEKDKKKKKGNEIKYMCQSMK